MKLITWFALVIGLVYSGFSGQCSAQPRDFLPPNFQESEVEQAALEFLEKYHPSHLEEFKRMKAARPLSYNKDIMHVWKRVEHFRMLKKEDPERYEIEIRQEILDEEISTLTHAYKTVADEKEKQDLRRKLMTAVSEQFDLHEQLRESEVKRMENELEQVKEKLKRRLANKNEIVKRRVDQLLNTAEGLGWE